MSTIWELAISSAVLPFTVLLIPIALYWALCLVGMLDFEFLDFDFDVEAEAEGGEIGDGTQGPGLFGNVFQGALKAVNATDVPMMVAMSILVIVLWGCVMLGNLWFNGDGSMSLAVFIALGSLISSVVLTKLITNPLKPVFRALKGGSSSNRPVLGRTGTIRSATLDQSGGQIEVEDEENPLLMTAKLVEGAPAMAKGEEVIIFRYDREKGVCHVRPLSSNT